MERIYQSVNMNEAAEGLRDSFVFGDPDTNQENKDAAIASGI